MLKSTSRRPVSFAIPFLAVAILAAGPAEVRADFVQLQISRHQSFEQTGPGTVTPTGAQFGANAGLGPTGNYTSATITAPGASTPIDMMPADFLGYTQATLGYPGFNTRDEMEAVFPLGAYSFAASGPAGKITGTLDDSVAFYPGAPTLTSATFSSLSHLDPAAEFVLQWNPLDPGISNQSVIFLFLADRTDPASPSWSTSTDIDATSYVIPANTFRMGHEYQINITVQNIIHGQGTRLVNSQSTSINFTVSPTAVAPEPSSVVMLGLGALGLLGHGWNRRRKVAAVDQP